MLYFFLLTLSSDHPPLPNDQFQEFLLKKVFSAYLPDFLQEKDLEYPFPTVRHCRRPDLRGRDGSNNNLDIIEECQLQYRDGMLHTFLLSWIMNLATQTIFHTNDKKYYRIDFLPHSVEHLTVTHCDQRFPLRTRRLPKEARRIDLSHNKYFGSIDLQSLPMRIVSMNLAHNNLQGAISLFRLPDTLEQLNLRGNYMISQSALYYGELPTGIVQIDLKRTHIRKVVPISPDYERKSVFH